MNSWMWVSIRTDERNWNSRWLEPPTLYGNIIFIIFSLVQCDQMASSDNTHCRGKDYCTVGFPVLSSLDSTASLHTKTTYFLLRSNPNTIIAFTGTILQWNIGKLWKSKHDVGDSLKPAEKSMEWKPVCNSCKSVVWKSVSSCSLPGVK